MYELGMNPGAKISDRGVIVTSKCIVETCTP